MRVALSSSGFGEADASSVCTKLLRESSLLSAPLFVIFSVCRKLNRSPPPQTPTSQSPECDLRWQKGLGRCYLVKGVACTGRSLCVEEAAGWAGRDGREGTGGTAVGRCRGPCRDASDFQGLRDAGHSVSSSASGGISPADSLMPVQRDWFWTPASRTEEPSSIVFHCHVRRTASERPQETHVCYVRKTQGAGRRALCSWRSLHPTSKASSRCEK